MHRVIVHSRYVKEGKDTEKEAIIIATPAHTSLAEAMRDAATRLIEMADMIEEHPVTRK